MKQIKVQFNKGGLCNFILVLGFFSAHRQEKKQEKKTDLARAGCPVSRCVCLCQVQLLLAQQKKTAAAGATGFISTESF